MIDSIEIQTYIKEIDFRRGLKRVEVNTPVRYTAGDSQPRLIWIRRLPDLKIVLRLWRSIQADLNREIGDLS